MNDSFDILAATTFGLESVAAHELRQLGYEAKGHATGRVQFRGDALAVARANLWLRTADRVLIRVAQFPCADFDTLFETVKSLPWEKWVPPDFAFPVNGRSVRSTLTSVPACQRTVKKGIVDRLMAAHRTSTLPETGPTVSIEIALLHDVATITLDTSGAGLHKRGYRPMVGEAALKETLAAGLVQLSVWRPDRPLIDPFCGTGTIAIEAALWGMGLPPGIHREFDAEQWPGMHDAWRAARDEARSVTPRDLGFAIHASDIDDRALDFARQAAKLAGVDRSIHFKKMPFERLESKAEHGCIITNPPYGVRLGEEAEIERLYRSMPVVLRGLPTWSFHILTGRLDLEQIFGQQATRRRKFYNSRIECWYFSFLGPKPPLVRPETDHRDDHIDSPPNDSEPEQPPLAPPPPVPAPAFGGLRERDLREIRDFGACLAKNVRHLRRYPSRGITCYRVYERDQVDVPIIIDVYEGRVHIAEYEREHSRSMAQQADWWDAVRETVAATVGVPVNQVYAKEKHRQRGLTQHEKQAESGESIVVQEGGLKFEVNLRDYIDTGLFLDHRLTRAMVRDQACGKRFLNLFCYTGAFTVYAAAGGAASTCSVDLSHTYLDWARRNLELNGLWSPRHALVRSDVMEWLRRHPRTPSYDLAVVDPPTFSNSKSTQEDWEVAEGHSALLSLLLPLMSPGGVIYFSTNYRRFKLDEESLTRMGANWREISQQTVPPEYRNTRIHRCWRIIAGASRATGG